jgi:hypothetical protein
MKSRLLKIISSGWRQMVGILRRKERAVVATTSKKSGVLLRQESWAIDMLMGLPTPTVERSIMRLNVVGTQPTPQSFTRNGQQKALFLTLLQSAHIINWSCSPTRDPNPSAQPHPLLLESLPLPTMLSCLILSRPCLVN